MAKRPKGTTRPARRPRAAPDQDEMFDDGGERGIAPPPKSSPDWPFYNAATQFQRKVKSELETREAERLPAGTEMRQTEPAHKRIHLLQLTDKKLEKIRKMWDGDRTPDLPVIE